METPSQGLVWLLLGVSERKSTEEIVVGTGMTGDSAAGMMAWEKGRNVLWITDDGVAGVPDEMAGTVGAISAYGAFRGTFEFLGFLRNHPTI